MTGSDVAKNSIRARAQIPPSGSDLNALDLALEDAVLSSASAAAVNGTSTALDSATSSFTPSASASGLSADSSSAAASSVVSATPANSESTSATSAAAPSKATASDAALSTKKVAVASSTLSDVPSASSAAVSEAPSPAPPASSPAATSKSNATFKTNPASDTPPTSSTSDPPASTTAPSPSAAPEPTSTTAPETSTTEAPAPSPTTSATTQRGAQSAPTGGSTPSKTNDQASNPTTSNGRNSNPTSEAASPQPSGSSDGPANQGNSGNSPSNASQRNSSPSATGASGSGNASSLGNGLIGVASSSNVHADSTLPTAEAVTITSDGSTIATTPPFLTSVFTSNRPDGSPQTFTSVFANPTAVPQASNLSDSSFWNNKGAVAGVFISVAIILFSTVLGIVYCCRRRRRRTMHRLNDETQDRHFAGMPDMSQPPTTYQPVRGLGFRQDGSSRYLNGPSSSNGHEEPTTMQRSLSEASHNSNGDMQQTGALGLTGILARPPGLTENYHGPFSDYHRYITTGDTRLVTPPGNSPMGMAVTSDFKKPTEPEKEAATKAERRSPSPAPSSPSIYPPSLPAVPEKDENDYLFYEQETKRRPESQLPTPPPRAVVNDSDPPQPQNPFSSPLDPIHDVKFKQKRVPPPPARINTNLSYKPLTPPDSSAGHSPATSTPQFSASEESTSTRPLEFTNAFSGAFLGRSVSLRAEPLPRPARNPLRLSAYGSSGSSLQSKEGPWP